MKKLIFPVFLAILLLNSCQDEVTPVSVPVLSENELKTLLFTREEEKLAFDVYNYAFEKHGSPVFKNIANSESQHIASILGLMDSYQINDPLNGSTLQGHFIDPVIKDLYAQLTSRVDLSLEEAIKVGLLIEDMDIYDLEVGIRETSNTQLTRVYSSLKCGSENHLRSFYSQAQNLSATYAPYYISQEQYTQIVNSSRTSCQANN